MAIEHAERRGPAAGLRHDRRCLRDHQRRRHAARELGLPEKRTRSMRGDSAMDPASHSGGTNG